MCQINMLHTLNFHDVVYQIHLNRNFLKLKNKIKWYLDKAGIEKPREKSTRRVGVVNGKSRKFLEFQALLTPYTFWSYDECISNY